MCVWSICNAETSFLDAEFVLVPAFDLLAAAAFGLAPGFDLARETAGKNTKPQSAEITIAAWNFNTHLAVDPKLRLAPVGRFIKNVGSRTTLANPIKSRVRTNRVSNS